MTRESIKAKIAALLAKAEGTDNAFEAETFMAKVNELLEKHQIDMTEIRNSSNAESDPLGRERGETNLYASMLWARDLAGGLARYCGCRLIYWRKGNHFTYDVIGRESARITFELMLPFVITQVKLNASRLIRERGGVVSRSILEREIGQALWVRISNMTKGAEKRRFELSKNALVPVDDLDAFIETTYANLKQGKQKTVKFSHAAKEAADRISLHAQATGRHIKLLS